MPTACSSCKKTASSSSAARGFACDVACCAPRCDYKQDPNVLQAVGVVKKHCYPAVDAPSQGDSMFGFSLALSQDGNVLVVGAPNYTVGTATNAGAVFVFERQAQFAACRSNDAEPFSLVQILTADKPETTTGSESVNGNFGMSVAISGDRARIAVGAPFQDVGPSQQSEKDEGAVFIFERGTRGKCGLHLWHQIQVVYAQKRTSRTDCTVVRDADNAIGFGYRIALSRNGGVLVVTDPYTGDDYGFVYIYEDCTPGPSFSPCIRDKKPYQFRQRITQEEVADASGITSADLMRIGNSVAVTSTGETIVFGAAVATVSGIAMSGAVFVYRRCGNGGGWVFSQEIDAGVLNGRNNFTGFGVAIAITPCGTYLVVEAAGSQFPSVVDANGFAIVYKRSVEKCGPVYVQQQVLNPESEDDENAFANTIFGQRSVAISDDGCVIALGFEFSTTISPSESDAGNVLLFERGLVSSSSSSSNSTCTNADKKCETTWTLKQTLFSDPQQKEALFGTAVAMSGSGLTLAVSAPSVQDEGILNSDHVGVAFTFSSTFKSCQLAART